MPTIRLGELGLGVRIGLTCLVLVLAGGLIASAAQVVAAHAGRDDRPGVSITDLEGAYHGVRAVAPMLAAIDRGHPDTLDPAEADVLRRWINGDRVSSDYDNLDLGDSAPAEIIARNCLTCHARQAGDGDGIGRRIPLEYWDDVAKVAFSRQIEPTPTTILIASTHTHALSLGTLTLVVCGLFLLTRWPRGLIGAGVLMAGLSLLLDLGGWWLTRRWGQAVYLIVAAGGTYVGVTVLMLLGVLVEMWLPRRAGRE